MTTPVPPYDLRVEAYLGATWVDLTATSDVYARRAIQIMTRGSGSEQDSVTPLAASAQLDNRGLKYSKSPTSPYYGLLTENTPVRIAYRQVNDTFTRSVASGWGSASTGQVYSFGGGVVADYSVNGTSGLMSVTAANSFRSMFFAGANDISPDHEVVGSASVGFGDVTGGPIEPATVILRRQSSTSYYLVKVEISASEAVTISVWRGTPDTLISAVVSVPGITHLANQLLRVRGQIEGAVIRGKVWVASGNEPRDWQVSATDTTITGAGAPGFRNGVSATNTNALPVVFTCDNVEVRHVRVHAGLVDIDPQSDLSGNDLWTDIELGGPLRVTGQGRSPVISLPRRIIPTTSAGGFGVIDYWPLDDGEQSVAGANAVAGGAAMSAMTQTPQRWAQGRIGSWLPPTFQGVYRSTGSNDGILLAPLRRPAGVFTLRFQVDYTVSSSADRAHAIAFCMDPSNVFIARWSVSMTPSINSLLVTAPDNTSSSVLLPEVSDGAPHHVRFKVEPGGGGDGRAIVVIDGAIVFDGSFVGQEPTAGFPPRFLLIDTTQGVLGDGVAVGHAAYYWYTALDLGPSSATMRDVALGNPGESCAGRLSRLAGENAIPLTVVNPPAASSQPCGPQYTKALPELLRDTAAVDAGILLESRSGGGLVYLGREWLYNTPVTLALTHGATGHLAAPLRSPADDRIVNDVTITRTGGSQSRVVVTAGPKGTGVVGVLDSSGERNVLHQDQAEHHAGWRALLGTWPEDRFPEITLNMGALPADKRHQALALNPGSRLTIASPPAWLPPDLIDLLVVGIRSERLDTFTWLLILVCVPYGPYRAPVEGLARASSDGTVVWSGSPLGTTTNSFFAQTPTGPQWITTAVFPSQFPFDIRIGGERIRVDAITFNSPTFDQFFVTRSINGIVKSHPGGAPIELWDKAYAPL